MTINKSQGQTLRRIAIYPSLPVHPHPPSNGRSMWDFPETIHLTTSLLQLWNSVDNAEKTIDR